MTHHKLYQHIQHARDVQESVLRGRQDSNQVPSLVPLTVVGAVLGGVGSLLLQGLQPRQQLQDHPMCGITTGGQVG